MEFFNEQIEEILADENFLAWASNEKNAASNNWQQWIDASAENSVLSEKALTLFNAIHLQEKYPSSLEIFAAKENLMDAISIQKMGAKKPFIATMKWLISAAACLLLIVGFYTWNNFYKEQKAITSFGERLEKKLPDGTSVLLNSNSTISYAPNWKQGKEREVWIKGEAFFHVAKTKQKDRFIVHTQRFDIIVTGTQFNITTSTKNDGVLLTEGSIIIRTQNGKEIAMQPGDYIAIGEDEMRGKPIETIHPAKENILAWIDKKIVFDNTSIKDVAIKIKEIYGVEVKISNEKIASKLITGIMPNDSLDILLQALEATADFKITKENNSIKITATEQ